MMWTNERPTDAAMHSLFTEIFSGRFEPIQPHPDLNELKQDDCIEDLNIPNASDEDLEHLLCTL